MPLIARVDSSHIGYGCCLWGGESIWGGHNLTLYFVLGISEHGRRVAMQSYSQHILIWKARQLNSAGAQRHTKPLI